MSELQHSGCYGLFNAMEALVQEQHRRIRDLESELLMRYQRITELESALHSQGGLHHINAELQKEKQALMAERHSLLARIEQLEGPSTPYKSRAPAPFVGFAVKKTANKNTIYVKDVAEGSPAEQAGLKDGDELIVMDNKPILTMAQFRSAIRQLTVGQNVRIEFLRDDRYGHDNALHKTVNLVVGTRAKPIISVPSMRTAADLEMILADPAKLNQVTAFAFAEADDDCSLLVTSQEFASSIRSWIPTWVANITDQEIMDVFNKADIDRSGFLTKSEFTPVIKALLEMYLSYARRM